MHEASIAAEIIEIIQKSLGCIKELNSVHLTIGPLSGISYESLSFCFTEIARQEGLGKPKLEITKTKAQILCNDCGFIYNIDDFYSTCPRCDSFSKNILSGNEFSVDSVELREE